MSPWVSYSAPLGDSFLISLDAFKTKVTGLQTASLMCELQFSRPSDFYYFHAEYLTLSSLADGLESTWSHRCLLLPENGANVYRMPNAFSPLAVKLGDGSGGQYPCWCFCLCSDFLLYLTLLLFPAFNFLHLGPHNLCQYSLFLVFYNGFIALSGRMKFSCPSSLRSSGFWSPGKHLVNDSESDYDSFGSNLLFSVNL